MKFKMLSKAKQNKPACSTPSSSLQRPETLSGQRAQPHSNLNGQGPYLLFQRTNGLTMLLKQLPFFSAAVSKAVISSHSSFIWKANLSSYVSIYVQDIHSVECTGSYCQASYCQGPLGQLGRPAILDDTVFRAVS